MTRGFRYTSFLNLSPEIGSCGRRPFLAPAMRPRPFGRRAERSRRLPDLSPRRSCLSVQRTSMNPQRSLRAPVREKSEIDSPRSFDGAEERTGP
ncbi:MAG: hypothetical protein MI923_29280 [Phycisphaerales bacterium]|nr:hypothetical protein [Phycisphaerales bacterium]